MPDSPSNLYRQIPPVDRILVDDAFQRLEQLYGRDLLRVQVQVELDRIRALIASDATFDLQAELVAVPKAVGRALASSMGKPLERVINATGILLHTNLGRAPLPRQVARQLPTLLDAYCDLEYSLADGKRADRNDRAGRLLETLTRAPAALVVNNNAAALVLILGALGHGREVVVSRGELVEIGGSFRIPDIVRAAGVDLKEVGTTNRTSLADYAAAITEQTALLLKVYPSNYRLAGYVSSVGPAELAGLARERGIPLVVDEGSGLLTKPRAQQIVHHPSLAEIVAAGAHLAFGSGDKLLGGPQAGLIVGESALVGCCRKHPLYRAVRPDRAALATLEAVLRMHLTQQPLPLHGLWPDPDEHRRRMTKLAEALGGEITEANAFLGGGAAPDAPVPGEALAFSTDATALAEELRNGHPPVVGYVKKGRLILDLRTVDSEDDQTLTAALRSARDRVARLHLLVP